MALNPSSAQRRRGVGIVAILLSFVAGPAAAELVAAGRVTFVIGAVEVVGAGGESRVIEAGAPILAGDRIVTVAGQHVHVRFVDGAYLSVRPGSRLAIERYDVGPQDTAIRFNLEQGVVRSITGEAAQARKDRFRLNTPMAAIGVRGTDFVVHAEGAGLRAVVNQGAIVVAPFSAGCDAQALGPCQTAEARELSDRMGRVLLELTGTQPLRIVPLNGSEPDPAAPREPAPGSGPALGAALETVGTTQPGGLRPGQLSPPPTPTSSSQLQWGRWASARAGDTLSVPVDQARAGRELTVGNQYASLYRPPGDSPVLSRQLGQASFTLGAAEVVLAQAGGAVTPGRVDGGWLQINFARRSFATGLSLSHERTGAVSLESSGKLREDGLFGVSHNSTRVAGAVSLDGSEAGYLFDKIVPEGTLSGTTLWKR